MFRAAGSPDRRPLFPSIARHFVRWRTDELGHPRLPCAVVPGNSRGLCISGGDGGNSYFCDDVRRGSELLARGGARHSLDVGTSGGVAGLERGYCLMIGGDAEPVEHLRPIFSSLAPGVAAASLTPGRSLTISRSGGRWSIEVSAGSARGGIHAISLYWVADGMRSDIMFIIICIEAMWSFIIW